MRTGRVLLVAFMACVPNLAHADDADEYAGLTLSASAGVVQHHFTVTENGQDREAKGTGFGGAATLGYSIPVGSRVLVGAEASVHFGGKRAETRIQTIQGQFIQFGIDPRYGWSAVGKLGYAISPTVMVFGSAGYGEHRYNLIGTTLSPQGGIIPAIPSKTTNSSFVLGGGAEYRIGPKVSLRADLRHLDGSRNEVLFGVQTRF